MQQDEQKTRATTDRPSRRWPGTMFVVALTAAIVIGAIIGVLEIPSIRRSVAHHLVPPRPDAPDPHFDLRRVVLDQRNRADASGRLVEEARMNGLLAQEALRRALAVHKAWLDRRHPETKLYAQSDDQPEWNYRNTAADFFCFQVHAGLRLNPSSFDSLAETFQAERALRTPEGLCQPVLAATAEPINVDHDELMFASAEYVKDGLISLYERHGGDLVGENMYAIVDAIMKQSREQSSAGALPGEGAEINGDLLQVSGRLSYATGRDDYAEFAARIAEAMIKESMAANHGIPPKFFDYESDKVVDATLKLKDHGNEALLGLAEAYAMAVDRAEQEQWSQRADNWAEPLAKMFEIVLEHGVNEQGLLAATMQPSPPKVTSSKLCDNWGYVLIGALLYAEAAERHGQIDPARLATLRDRVDTIARMSLSGGMSELWSGGMDSAADAIESAIYMAAYRPELRAEALAWADEFVRVMYAYQTPEGPANARYLDGNFMRTAMLYADARSGGWRVVPWREDVQVGFAEDPEGNAAVVVQATEPYAGRLVPDQPRHRTILNLPWNWPRLNSWPEWFTMSGDVRLTGAAGVSGSQEIDPQGGVALDLPAHGEAVLMFAPSD